MHLIVCTMMSWIQQPSMNCHEPSRWMDIYMIYYVAKHDPMPIFSHADNDMLSVMQYYGSGWKSGEYCMVSKPFYSDTQPS